ncbi:MAG: glycerol-3-phosphate 1-O-acyltransferase PlsY [Opitutae bacterium]|nr:glycerol-3-phosphate 1-O-acyltransferase PlsY [Opitutae bacterium]
MFTPFLIAGLAGYFLGALPFGYLIARARGVNIFEVGSKNPGATNVLRVLGKGPGYLAFALDASKGAVATGWIGWCLACGGSCAYAQENLVYLQITGLVAALVGHSFSCFTRFKGGKGVATGAGGFLVLMSLPTLIAIAVWVIAFYASRYVSLASILAALALPIAGFALGQPAVVTVIAAVVGGFVVFRHRANIVRLLNGTENKFAKKPAAPK